MIKTGNGKMRRHALSAEDTVYWLIIYQMNEVINKMN